MAYFQRDYRSCPHRSTNAPTECSNQARSTHDEARCSVVYQIAAKVKAGVDADRASRVTRDVCDQCCRWHEPSTDHFNPVIGSLVLDRIVDQDDASANAALRERGVNALPVASKEPDGRVPRRDPPTDLACPDRLASLLPLPRINGSVAPRSSAGSTSLEQSASEKSWMIGVTTSPREQPTLDHCLDSIGRAGWAHAYVFADGIREADERTTRQPKGSSSQPTPSCQFTTVHRQTRVGGWSNFVLSALEMVHRNPDADGYLMLQDDAMLARFSALRPYMDCFLDQIGSCAIASLYSCEADTLHRPGWSLSTETYLRGAQAILFTREAMWRFVDSGVTRPWQVPWHHGNRRPLEQRGIDGNVGLWARQSGIPVWLPTPSLVWHLGDTSTLWPGAVMMGIRRAGSFLEFVAETDNGVKASG